MSLYVVSSSIERHHLAIAIAGASNREKIVLSEHVRRKHFKQTGLNAAIFSHYLSLLPSDSGQTD